MVLHHCGHKMDLNVRHFQLRASFQEGTGFKAVRCPQTRLKEYILHACHQHTRRVCLAMQCDRLKTLFNHCRIQMILHVLTHTRKVSHNVNTKFPQILAVPNARKHKGLRGVDRATTQHDFFASPCLHGVAFLSVFNTNSLFALEENPRGQSFCLNRQVWTIQNGGQIPFRRTTPLIVFNCQMVRTDTFLLRAIEILRRRMPRLNASFSKCLEQYIRILYIRDAKRAFAAVEFI